MPCCDERGPCTRPDPEIQAAADRATRAACDLRTILRRGGTEADLCPETREWIRKHDDWDARRIAAENAAGIRQKLKANALAKLTLDERRVLGL